MQPVSPVRTCRSRGRGHQRLNCSSVMEGVEEQAVALYAQVPLPRVFGASSRGPHFHPGVVPESFLHQLGRYDNMHKINYLRGRQFVTRSVLWRTSISDTDALEQQRVAASR